MTQPLSGEIEKAIAAGRLIEAIKLLRRATGADLKTAKEQVETWARDRARNAAAAAGATAGGTHGAGATRADRQPAPLAVDGVPRPDGYDPASGRSPGEQPDRGGLGTVAAVIVAALLGYAAWRWFTG